MASSPGGGREAQYTNSPYRLPDPNRFKNRETIYNPDGTTQTAPLPAAPGATPAPAPNAAMAAPAAAPLSWESLIAPSTTTTTTPALVNTIRKRQQPAVQNIASGYGF